MVLEVHSELLMPGVCLPRDQPILEATRGVVPVAAVGMVHNHYRLPYLRAFSQELPQFVLVDLIVARDQNRIIIIDIKLKIFSPHISFDLSQF